MPDVSPFGAGWENAPPGSMGPAKFDPPSAPAEPDPQPRYEPYPKYGSESSGSGNQEPSRRNEMSEEEADRLNVLILGGGITCVVVASALMWAGKVTVEQDTKWVTTAVAAIALLVGWRLMLRFVIGLVLLGVVGCVVLTQIANKSPDAAKKEPEPAAQVAPSPPKGVSGSEPKGTTAKTPEKAKPTPGHIVIRATQPVSVSAFVEVDGERVAAWPVGTSELRLPVEAGKRRVVYRSKAGGKYYQSDFGSPVVPAGGEKVLTLNGVVPDPTGRW